jgi:NAD-dependent deacetylase
VFYVVRGPIPKVSHAETVAGRRPAPRACAAGVANRKVRPVTSGGVEVSVSDGGAPGGGTGRPVGDLATVARWIREASTVTVLTGAGISTDSGIPDFRGPQGVWTRNPGSQRMSDIRAYVSDPELRRQAWRGRREHSAWSARPNAAHLALVELERAGRLRALITQNIDELHQRAGNDPALVLELHGTVFVAACLSCGHRMPMSEVLDRVERGEEDPCCLRCGGLLKSATVSFGQSLDPDVLAAAGAAAADCELLLVVGSSLTVHPAAGLVDVAAAAGARVVIVNAEPTPYDDIAAALVRDPIGIAVPALVADLSDRS